jgi:luciferase-type oxidoreductase
MTVMNRAYQQTLAGGRLTIGLTTPAGRARNGLADVLLEQRIAKRADELGFSALWARDVPLVIAQGSDDEASVLDDPFVWLTSMAHVTGRIALGTAAAVLPLHHPLLLAKSALSLDRLSGGRFIFGLGSGDRPSEFAAFGVDVSARGDIFRAKWPLLRAALSPDTGDRAGLLEATGGYDVLLPPERRIPMIVVGSARQSLQWIAGNADGWATYHREEAQQKGRIGLWQAALRQRSEGEAKPFIQSLHLDLLDEPTAAAEPLELGLRVGRRGLIDYLLRVEALGVSHVLLHLARSERAVLDIVDEIGAEILPLFQQGPNASPIGRVSTGVTEAFIRL